MTLAHTTTGTERRAAHTLSGDGLVFRLSDEIDELRADLRRSSGGRSAKTLAKVAGLRVTLVVMDSGVEMQPEAAAGGASLQVLEGRVSVQTDGAVEDVRSGEMVVLGHNLRQPVRATEQAAFLVTVAWPEGAGAWSQEASQGHL
jgi:quercetin dioxygenase-like cupin family protein